MSLNDDMSVDELELLRIGEIGWSSPRAQALHTEMKRCQETLECMWTNVEVRIGIRCLHVVSVGFAALHGKEVSSLLRNLCTICREPSFFGSLWGPDFSAQRSGLH